MNINKTAKYSLFAALLFIPFMLYIVHPLINYNLTDIGRYLSTAMVTFSHHNWSWPKTIYGAFYLEKGPVLYWIYQMLWFLSHNKTLVFSITHFLLYLAVGFSAVNLSRSLTQKSINLISTSYVLIFVLFSALILNQLFDLRFDKLLTILILLNWALCIDILHTNKPSRAILLTITTILGPLVKGPVFTLYTLPLMLLLPFVIDGDKKRYYCCTLPALLLGICIPLLYLHFIKTSLHDKSYLVEGQMVKRIGFLQNFNKHLIYLTRPFTTLIPWIFAPSVIYALYTYCKDKQHKTSIVILLTATIIPFCVLFFCVTAAYTRYVLPIYVALLLLMAVATYNANYQRIIKADKYYCLLLAVLVTTAVIVTLFFEPMRQKLFYLQSYAIFCMGYGIIAIALLLHIATSKKPLSYSYFLVTMAISALFMSFLYNAKPFNSTPFSQVDQITQAVDKYLLKNPNTVVAVYHDDAYQPSLTQWIFYKMNAKDYFVHIKTQQALDKQVQKNKNLLLISFMDKPTFANLECFYHQKPNTHNRVHDKKQTPINFYMCRYVPHNAV